VKYAPDGQIYQIDPFGRRQAEKMMISTWQGGRYEAFVYYDRNKQDATHTLRDRGPT
jgi:hypothetical protein